MPVRIKGVSAKLIEAAREEFFDKGFKSASIRDISSKAETSPRAVYTRFKNKEELFAAVVQPVLDSFYEQFMADKEEYRDEESEKNAGTRYENFIKDLAEADIKSVVSHLEMLHDHDIEFGADEKDILFVESITYSFYRDLFKPLIKCLSLDNAKQFAATLTNFYNFGLMGIMGMTSAS